MREQKRLEEEEMREYWEELRKQQKEEEEEQRKWWEEWLKKREAEAPSTLGFGLLR